MSALEDDVIDNGRHYNRPAARQTRKSRPVVTVYRASYESRHFSFEAFDTDPEMATAHLVRALYHHATTYPDVSQTWFADASAEVLKESPQPIVLGLGYRDGSPCDARPA